MPNATPLIAGPTSHAEIRRLERRIDSGESMDIFGDFSRLIDLYLENGDLPEAEEVSQELLQLAEDGQIRWAIPAISKSDRMREKAQRRRELPVFIVLFLAIALVTCLWRQAAIIASLTDYCLATDRPKVAALLLKTEIGFSRLCAAKEGKPLKRALIQLADIELKEGQFEQCEVHARQALLIDPNSRASLSLLADCYMAQSDNRSAEDALLKMVSLPPIWREDRDTMRLIEVYRRRNRHTKAMELLPLVKSFSGTVTAFAAQNRAYPSRVTALANLYRDGGMYEIAAYLYEQAYFYRGRQSYYIDYLNTRANLIEFAELCRRTKNHEQSRALLQEAQNVLSRMHQLTR